MHGGGVFGFGCVIGHLTQGTLNRPKVEREPLRRVPVVKGSMFAQVENAAVGSDVIGIHANAAGSTLDRKPRRARKPSGA